MERCVVAKAVIAWKTAGSVVANWMARGIQAFVGETRQRSRAPQWRKKVNALRSLSVVLMGDECGCRGVKAGDDGSLDGSLDP